MADQTLKNQKENIHLWCLHKKGVARGVLKNCQVFADSVILNIRSIVHFCGWWKWLGGQGSFVGHSFVDVINE